VSTVLLGLLQYPTAPGGTFEGHPQPCGGDASRACRRTRCRLHTARSRNDQIATDIRYLYARRSHGRLGHSRAAGSFAPGRLPITVRLSSRGITHTRAQPSVLGHHRLAYVEMLARDCGSAARCLLSELNVFPLGLAPWAGSPLSLDREYVGLCLLGFASISRNSWNGLPADYRYFLGSIFARGRRCTPCTVASGGKLVAVVDCANSIRALRLIVYHRFGIMAAEAQSRMSPSSCSVRRAALRLAVHCCDLKGQPLITINRDLQDDKAPYLEAVDTRVHDGLNVAAANARQRPLF